MPSREFMRQIDVAMSTGAITSPAWLPLFRDGVQIYMLVGGAIVLTFRLIAAFREWRRGG